MTNETNQALNKITASLDRTNKFTTYLNMGNHQAIADEPREVGGNDLGPTPYQFVGGGLAACTALTIQMYAKRKNWELTNVTVHVDYSRNYIIDCEDCENPSAKIETFLLEVKLEGNLTTLQKERLMQIGEKCPVHKTLQNEVQILSTLVL